MPLLNPQRILLFRVLGRIAVGRKIEEPYPELQKDRPILREFALEGAPHVQRFAGAWEVACTLLSIPHPYKDGTAQEWIAPTAVFLSAPGQTKAERSPPCFRALGHEVAALGAGEVAGDGESQPCAPAGFVTGACGLDPVETVEDAG